MVELLVYMGVLVCGCGCTSSITARRMGWVRWMAMKMTPVLHSATYAITFLVVLHIMLTGMSIVWVFFPSDN